MIGDVNIDDESSKPPDDPNKLSIGQAFQKALGATGADIKTFIGGETPESWKQIVEILEELRLRGFDAAKQKALALRETNRRRLLEKAR
jgi:hypothetical protein